MFVSPIRSFKSIAITNIQHLLVTLHYSFLNDFHPFVKSAIPFATTQHKLYYSIPIVIKFLKRREKNNLPSFTFPFYPIRFSINELRNLRNFSNSNNSVTALLFTPPPLFPPLKLRARKCGEINSASITRETCADNGDPVSPCGQFCSMS